MPEVCAVVSSVTVRPETTGFETVRPATVNCDASAITLFGSMLRENVIRIEVADSAVALTTAGAGHALSVKSEAA